MAKICWEAYPILRIGFSRSYASARQDGLGWGLAESKVIRGFDPVEGMREMF